MKIHVLVYKRYPKFWETLKLIDAHLLRGSADKCRRIKQLLQLIQNWIKIRMTSDALYKVISTTLLLDNFRRLL